MIKDLLMQHLDVIITLILGFIASGTFHLKFKKVLKALQYTIEAIEDEKITKEELKTMTELWKDS